ncbi:hypothetical protein ERO13_A06G043800v2 [Gossypium hirsutum]|uniref:Uncharacterized protein isoform X2 n=1 Tax=Gossypium hirsutum TaxID=3635 RepID=A0ABM3BV56_GOSHI|nr:uncharacterized protein LOC107962509 isoform X2 [Gossypium hirsutum]KAG4194273.1 hypothetical protein ERO13_A06G043800v2 [Gossypium hirsutum]
MDDSDEKKEPEVAIVNGTVRPEGRSVRRRLIQSTLFPQKSPEIEPKVDQKAKEGEDDDKDGEDEDFCGSQGKKGRRRKGKVTPQNRASKKAKSKSPVKTTPKKTTPKKNGMNNLMESEDILTPQIPNLRLEAKLTAEENSQMFAGRQIHPFFTSWKAGKRSQETAEVGKDGALLDISDERINIGPIHVFERTQDDLVLDWKDWSFFEKTSFDTFCNPEGLFKSVFESYVEALCIDNFPDVSHFSNASFVQSKLSDQCIIEDNDLLGKPPAIPAVIVDEQLESYKLLKSSERVDTVENSELEQSRLLQERMVPCYYDCSLQPESDNSLWTDKYQPKSATEVCGNIESVKFMSDWLRLWCKRSFRAIKASNNIDKQSMQEDSDDDFCASGSDSENIDEEDSLKNVLLVTGPIGSGKSVAIHTCAEEQGFKILESNASDCRNGAVVKQKFGEALESHCLTGSIENLVDSPSKHVMKSAGPLSKGEAMKEFDKEVEFIPIPDEEDSSGPHGASGKHVCNDRETGFGQDKVRSLILFEDVDISFPEDRGFVPAIQKIAEKARGPVILTSNSNNLVLPDNLDRLELCFTMPSREELLHHLNMVCAAEKAIIQPYLLEQLIKCCQGDIRKTIMHLQFWCQSKKYQKGGKSQKTYGLLLFDIEAGHLVLPTVIPWGFPSQLSELVEKEIAEKLSLMGENPTLMEVMEDELEHNNMPNGLEMHNNEINSIEAKKEVMSHRNFSIHDCYESINPSYTAHDFYNSSGTPVSFSRRTSSRKLDVVMSSDSEDEDFNKHRSLVSDLTVNRELFIEEDYVHLSHSPNRPLTDELLNSEVDKCEGRGFQCSEAENNLKMETCESLDVSYVPETEIVNGMELSSRTLSCANVSETTEVSVSCEFEEGLLPAEANDHGKFMHMLIKTSDISVGTCNIIAEASHEEVVENSQNQYEAVSSGLELMDECSRMNFNKKSFSMGKFRNQVATDLVQESWKKLRNSHADLKLYVDSEPKDALNILKLTCRMSDLISQADQLLSKCQMQDSLEMLIIPSENSDAFVWHDKQLQMANTISQHGFCLYAKEIDALRLKMGFEHRVDLSQEILASSTSTMALGRLLRHDASASRTSVDGKGLAMTPSKHELAVKRDVKSCLFDIISSMVPSRFCLALKGDAFHEYVSSLGYISKSEASRLSVGTSLTKRCRTRRSRHYLSTGALMLSPEDISLLEQYNFNGKLSSNN